MTYPLYTVLTDLVEDDNTVAKIALLKWDSFKHGVIKYDELKAILKGDMPMTFQQDDPKSQKNPWHDKDLRIKSLTIENFRGIPQSETGIPYGLSLSLNNEANGLCSSLVLLGANGTGKTSIYSALEYMWIGTTSIARKHQAEKRDLNEFYSNVRSQGKEPEINTILNDGKEICLKDKSQECISDLVDLRNFFCSESDLAMIECGGEDIDKYVEGEIGIGELVELKEMLEDARVDIQNKFKEVSKDSDYSEGVKFELDRLNHISDDIDKTLNRISAKIEEIQSAVLSDSQTILENLLKDYTDDNEAVEPSFKSVGSKKLFNGRLQLKSRPQRTFSPRDYFNNFRFKMYLVSIRVAIAFYVMKSRKINFPLIFDDIFDSSDFQNRINTRRFIRKIVNEYYNLQISDKPLQIIFFTQDEIIAQSIYEGITKPTIEFPHSLDAILGRLFPASKADKQDLVILNANTRIKGNNSIEQKKEQLLFYNLYDKIQCRKANPNK